MAHATASDTAPGRAASVAGTAARAAASAPRIGTFLTPPLSPRQFAPAPQPKNPPMPSPTGCSCDTNGTPVWNQEGQVPPAVWTYAKRSVWFEKRAILVVSIFLAIFIIIIVGIAVFLRDRSALESASDSASQRECGGSPRSRRSPRVRSASDQDSPTAAATGPRRGSRRFHRLRRRARRRSSSSSRSGDALGSDSPTSPALSADRSQADSPPEDGAENRPQDTPPAGSSPALESVQEYPERGAPASPPAPPGAASSDQPYRAADASDVEAINRMDWDSAAAVQPPAYVYAPPPAVHGGPPRSARAADKQRQVPLPEDDPPSHPEPEWPQPAVQTHVPPEDTSVSVPSGHIATDDKSALHALMSAASAPPLSWVGTASNGRRGPSAPPVQGPVMDEPDLEAAWPTADQEPGMPADGTPLPAPAPAFLPRFAGYDQSFFLGAGAQAPMSEKEREAAAERQALATLLPTAPSEEEPGLPPPTAPELTSSAGLAPPVTTASLAAPSAPPMPSAPVPTAPASSAPAPSAPTPSTLPVPSAPPDETEPST